MTKDIFEVEMIDFLRLDGELYLRRRLLNEGPQGLTFLSECGLLSIQLPLLDLGHGSNLDLVDAKRSLDGRNALLTLQLLDLSFKHVHLHLFFFILHLDF